MTSTRREFLSALAVPGLALAAAPGSGTPAAPDAFAPGADWDDDALFAAARKQFLIPPGVAYCNTGTLGASPREVVEVHAAALRRLEAELADWPYERPEGEPLTGYQPLVELRGAVGFFVNAPAGEIALTQNATMGMNFLANGLDLAAGDEVVSTDQEHGGGISPWRLAAKRRGVVLKELPLEPALATVEAVRAHTVALLRRLPEAAWAREGTHSQSGRYSAETWLEVYAEHLEKHARQIERNLAAWEAKGVR